MMLWLVFVVCITADLREPSSVVPASVPPVFIEEGRQLFRAKPPYELTIALSHSKRRRICALVDRRASHTDQCASCSRARATAARVETVAHAAAFGLLALAALATDGRGVLVVAAAVAYGAHAGARALLPAFDDGALVPPRNLG